MWIGPTGQRLESPLRNPIPLHGGMTSTGELAWIDVEGRRLKVVRKGIRFVIYDEWSLGVCGSARCYELSDGSYWLVARDLISGKRWLGERLSCEGASRTWRGVAKNDGIINS